MSESAPVSWETLDWSALEALRRRFLEGKPGGGAYWRTWSDLASYDFTYGQRIGWKWDAVLRELALRGWRPPPGPLLDWGCGSGVAGRRILEFYGSAAFGVYLAEDHAPLAMRYAQTAARRAFPGLTVRSLAGWRGGVGTLAISHVLNELDSAGRGRLAELLGQARAVLWVEPGTFADSRALIDFREEWLRDFDVIAPCTHLAQCGMLHAHNAAHWCHHFAVPPAGVLADGHWIRFGQRAGIDLRSIPYSFLVLARRGPVPSATALMTDDWSRLIGRPRLYKGFAKVLNCSAADVAEVEIWQRDNPELLRAYKKERGPVFLRGHSEGKNRLVVAETRGPAAAAAAPPAEPLPG